MWTLQGHHQAGHTYPELSKQAAIEQGPTGIISHGDGGVSRSQPQEAGGRDLEKIIPEGAMKHLLSRSGCEFIL